MDRQELIQYIKDHPFAVLSDLVYQYIVDAIVDVRFVPGSKINTKQISEELGISRTPVRTALERLVDEKLVEQVNNVFDAIGLGVKRATRSARWTGRTA